MRKKLYKSSVLMMKPYIQSYCRSIKQAYNYSLILMNRRSVLMSKKYSDQVKTIKKERIIDKITMKLKYLNARHLDWLSELESYNVEVHSPSLGVLKIPYVTSMQNKVNFELISP